MYIYKYIYILYHNVNKKYIYILYINLIFKIKLCIIYHYNLYYIIFINKFKLINKDLTNYLNFV